MRLAVPSNSEGWPDRGGNASRTHKRAPLAQDAHRAVSHEVRDGRSHRFVRIGDEPDTPFEVQTPLDGTPAVRQTKD